MSVSHSRSAFSCFQSWLLSQPNHLLAVVSYSTYKHAGVVGFHFQLLEGNREAYLFKMLNCVFNPPTLHWSLAAQRWLTPLLWLLFFFFFEGAVYFAFSSWDKDWAFNFQWRTRVYDSIFLSSRTPGWKKITVNKLTPLLPPEALWPRARVAVVIEWADGPWLSPLLWSPTADRTVAWLQTNSKRIMIVNYVKLCGRACVELWGVWSADVCDS